MKVNMTSESKNGVTVWYSSHGFIEQAELNGEQFTPADGADFQAVVAQFNGCRYHSTAW